MQKLFVGVIALAAALLPLTAARAEEDTKNLIKATLLADADAIVPGQPLMLGVKLTIKPHWHTYWINPGDAGGPTTLKPTGPAGLEFGSIQWPIPHRIEADGLLTYGYENEVMLLMPVKVSKDLAVGSTAKIEIDAEWLVCKEECIEGEAKLTLSLPVKSEARPANEAEFAKWRGQLPVSGEDAKAAAAIAKIEQPQPGGPLQVTWKTKPAKVEWFPVSNRAAVIEDVTVKEESGRSVIGYKTTIYKAELVPGGAMQSVLVYEDAQGRRHGVTTPFRVKLP